MPPTRDVKYRRLRAIGPTILVAVALIVMVWALGFGGGVAGNADHLLEYRRGNRPRLVLV